ncbi:hypothetical protein [Desulfovibrio sp. JC010]|uniref:hypothetical protein n=1 Tax=Desulfovibrio sp. JC010 TaxID=2593641 RepID=UPI0013D5CB78|nr:hypothetical protein [Desulfovibrio sp. JC010]NDV25986.1 hypothetical protein [Desulfovibrio sp. JC010]
MALSSLCALSFEELLKKFSNRTTEFVRILHALCQSRMGQDMYHKSLIEYAELQEQLKQIRRKRSKLIRESKELDRKLEKQHGKEGVAELDALASDIVNRNGGEPTGAALEEAVAEMKALSMDIISRRSA